MSGGRGGGWGGGGGGGEESHAYKMDGGARHSCHIFSRSIS